MQAPAKEWPFRRVGISILLAALVAGCSGEKPEQFFAKAKQQYEHGDRVAAVIDLKNAIQKDPDYADARLLLGKVYVDQGNGASAEKELRRALDLGVARETVLPLLGRALLARGEPKKVLEEITVPSNGKAENLAAIWVVRGNALLALKQLDEAQTAFETARKLNPVQADAMQGLALLAVARQHADEAMKLADEAISASARQPATQQSSPWQLKADLLRSQGKKQEAEQAYQEAIKHDPNNVSGHLGLASLYLEEQKFDAAQKELDAAKKIDTHSLMVRLAQAQLDFSQKKYSKARDNLQEILKVAPNHGPSVLLMGATQLALESYVQAEAYLSSYVKAVPGNLQARRLLAAAQLKMKQPAKALETLAPVLSQETQDGGILAMAGEAHMQLQQYAQATEYLERAAKVMPNNAALRTSAALSMLAGGDATRGTAELEQAAGMEGSPVQTDVALVYALLNNKQYDKALDAVAALEKKQPTNPMVYNLRGGVYAAKQDFANARKALEKALSLQPGYYPAAANLAQLDMRDKNPQAARRRFEGVLAANKNSADAMVGIAELERAAGHEQDYVSWLDKASRADAKAIKPRALLAQYYVSKKDAPRALDLAREAETANPNSAEALYLLGTTQLAAGEKDNAVATFDRLVTLNPQSAMAYTRLGQAQAANNSPSDARKSLQQALGLKPDLIPALTAMVDLDMKENRVDDAIKLARQIQQQQPKLSLGLDIEAGILASQKQFAKSAELFQKALDIGKTSALAQKLYAVLVAAGRTGDAEKQANGWLKSHPDDVAMRMYLGDNYLKQNKQQQAIAQYQAILQSAPDNLVALNNLAWLLHQQRQPQALSYAERAYKLRPDDAAVMDTFGWILVEEGQTQRGLDMLQQATSKAPDSTEIRYHLALAFNKKGDTTRAANELQRLLNSGINFPQEAEARALLARIKPKQ